MAGGKGKSIGGKGSGAKDSGSKSQKSHSAKAGLQVRSPTIVHHFILIDANLDLRFSTRAPLIYCSMSRSASTRFAEHQAALVHI